MGNDMPHIRLDEYIFFYNDDFKGDVLIKRMDDQQEHWVAQLPFEKLKEFFNKIRECADVGHDYKGGH